MSEKNKNIVMMCDCMLKIEPHDNFRPLGHGKDKSTLLKEQSKVLRWFHESLKSTWWNGIITYKCKVIRNYDQPIFRLLPSSVRIQLI